MDNITQIWQEYEKSKNYLANEQVKEKSEKCHDFVDGDQWKGLVVPKGMDRPPQMNILLPIMKNATALVGQNTLEISFSPLNKTSNKQNYILMCQALNKFVRDSWERLKMDAKVWDILEDAFITGDSILYSYWENDGIKVELLDNINVMYGDENNPNIQEQPYILIPQRKYVEDVKKEALINGISEEDIDNIVADDNVEKVNGNRRELENDTKVTVITKLWKQDGVVHIARATKSVIYQNDTALQTADGIVSLYPLAKYSWKLRKNSARGAGDIWDKIPNQIEINKGVYRFCQAVKTTSFPHKIFLENALPASEVEKLDIPGSNIAIRSAGGIAGIGNLVGYMQPGNISPYAAQLWENLIQQTRELSGAGDNLENVNPEQASGSAINAAREAKALNVNAQVSLYKQFIEDVAMIWADLWKAYSIEMLDVVIDGMRVMVSPSSFKDLEPSVRVDISPNTPWSRYASEMELKELFTAGAITFEEYVNALDDHSNVPKAKLLDILENRRRIQENALSAMQNGNVQGQIGGVNNGIWGYPSANNLQMSEQTMY